MSRPRQGIGTTLILVVVVVTVLMVGTVAFLVLSAQTSTPPHGTQSQTTASISSTSTTQTCTAIPNLSFLYCSSNPLRISEQFETTSGAWNYTISINSTSAASGHALQLIASLTNTGSNATINGFVEPFINPEVYGANGTELWQWNPPQTTSSTVTFPFGQTISQTVDIPTLNLQGGQTYFLKVLPIFIAVPTPNNLTATLQFTVK